VELPVWCHDFDLFDAHLQPFDANMTQGKRMMPSTKNETQRARAQSAELTKLYRAIGPADLRAALICTTKKRKNASSVTAKAA
jgi:hypothetical protein